MGKASRKKNRVNKNRLVSKKVVYTPHELQMRQQMETGEYAEALETLAIIIKGKNLKPEFIYDGAVAYFKLGDLKRAAEWVNNTLAFAADHVGARILLAEICFAEQRRDDGLKLLEFLLLNGAKSLSATELADIGQLARKELVGNGEELRQKYPCLTEKYGAKEISQPKTASTSDILQALKAKISQVAEKQTEETIPKQQFAMEEPISGAMDENVSAKIAEVLAKNISVVEKVQLLGMFAGGYYLQSALIEAEKCLQEALKLSPEDYLLRNMALLQSELGNKEKALAFATKIKQTDFSLLRQIR